MKGLSRHSFRDMRGTAGICHRLLRGMAVCGQAVAPLAMVEERQIFRFKVTLRGSRPPIWRRFEVPGSVTLYQLHRILQAVMGWTDTHLHEFQRGQVSYGESDPEFGVRQVSERKTRLHDVLQRSGDRMSYQYDFGGGWEHDLVLEAVARNSAGKLQPRVLQGRRACPPEDVGGIYGYYEFLEAMGNPEHPSIRRWLTGGVAPSTQRRSISTMSTRLSAGCGCRKGIQDKAYSRR